MEIIRKAFADGVVRPGFIGLADVEQAGERNKEEAMTSLRSWVAARMPTDIHAYISWFSEFHPEVQTPPPAPSPADQKSQAEKKKKTSPTKNKTAKKAKKKTRG